MATRVAAPAQDTAPTAQDAGFVIRPRTTVQRAPGAGRKAWGGLPGLDKAVMEMGLEDEIWLEHKGSLVRAWLKRHFGTHAPYRVLDDKSGPKPACAIHRVRNRG
jgi:hypothetical protein